ncbi:remorin [Dorcoceras hygrometricum]|uniref:Remorin n=1 Tax=Dorcoceras hygrometricum TaxID=472368 RepID=A0A2Z7C9L3_9LAMI|nr:remorin [Dorcoceras hygrometricum]
MTAEESRKVEPVAPPQAAVVEAPKDVAREKAVVPHPTEEKPDDSKALAVVEKPAEGKEHGGSMDRDAVLARVVTEKRLSFIRAWEESEKSKAENKAQKKLSAVGVWENCKKAALEAELKQIEEKLEKTKSQYIEKVKNKVALVHKAAEEKRATTEAKRGILR